MVGGDEGVEPGAGADVDDPLAGFEAAQRERVADPGERLDRPLRQPVDDGRVVAEALGEAAAGVEVVAAARIGGDLAVLLADLGPQRGGVRDELDLAGGWVGHHVVVDGHGGPPVGSGVRTRESGEPSRQAQPVEMPALAVLSRACCAGVAAWSTGRPARCHSG